MTDRIITSNFSSLTNMDPFDLTDYAGDFASDFDMNAASYDFYTALITDLTTFEKYTLDPETISLGISRALANTDIPIEDRAIIEEAGLCNNKYFLTPHTASVIIQCATTGYYGYN